MSSKRKNIVWVSVLVIAVSISIYLFKNHPSLFDFVLKPTQREIYYREFDKDKIKALEQSKMAALNTDILLSQSFSQIIFKTAQPVAYGYTIEVAQGENLIATINREHQENLLLFELYDSENRFLAQSMRLDSLMISHQIENNQQVKLIVQVLNDLIEPINLKIYKEPQFAFPVAGKGNRAIQSFWGASRGGGSRSHEGNDIFASKGHPVVAVSKSWVTSVRNRGLGGKQIWLKDDDTGNSLYYAHLDEWLVETGDQLEVGDTIGSVGNTGNARTTPPHLHFGIYKNGKAIDPKPFIWQTEAPPNSAQLLDSDFTSSTLGNQAQANGNAANMRKAPSIDAEIIEDVGTQEVLMFGNSGDWYHVQALSGKVGFMHKSVLMIETSVTELLEY